MAPVPHEPQARYTPLIVVVSHVTTALYLTVSICRGLYRSYTGLRPSQDTRLRISQRRKVTPIFAALTVLSLATSVYHAARYTILSYNVWVNERGLKDPNSFFHSESQSMNGTDEDYSPYTYLRAWLTEVPLYRDAAEVVAEKARRFWWGNQRGLASIPWGMLLAIEGRRRKMPFLWAYLVLSQLVNLSFAQNLFYLSLLVSPTPLENSPRASNSRLSMLLARVFPPKPNNWCPHPGLFLVLLILNYAALALLPYVAGTPLFPLAMSANCLLTLSPVVLPMVVPESWGTVHGHPHDAYGAYTSLFRFISFASVVLHSKASVSGLLYNLPGSHEHRHSVLMPFDVEERSDWERTTTAVGRVLGSVADHPAVSAVATDVLLSALSLGLWAAVRALDVDDMLMSVIPYYRPGLATYPLTGGPSAVEGEGPSEEAHIKKQPEPPAEPRRRGRARKSTTSGKDTSSNKAEDDEGTTTSSSPKKRGRSRKTKAEPDKTAGDEAYVPSPSVAEAVVEGDEILEEDDWEAASLAWGLTVFGGLGAGSAGVFGAECISR